MLDFKEYVNKLLRTLFSIRPDENKNICALLRFSPDIESYRIFLEEYLCFKLAMVYQTLIGINFLPYNDYAHTEEKLANGLIDEAISIINSNVIQIPNFFTKPDVADSTAEHTQSISRDLIIRKKFADRWVMYERGRGLYLHHMFKTKLPASLADKIDDDELFNVIYGGYHSVGDEIERMKKYRTAVKDETIIHHFFPNIGKFGELIIATIVYFFIPMMALKWICGSRPIALRELVGIGYGLFISVYLLRCNDQMDKYAEETKNHEWIGRCLFIYTFIVFGFFIMK